MENVLSSNSLGTTKVKFLTGYRNSEGCLADQGQVSQKMSLKNEYKYSKMSMSIPKKMSLKDEYS